MSNSLYFNHVLPSGLAIVTPPTEEPISVAEAKRWIRLEADYTAEDDDIAQLIAAARTYAEAYQKRTLLATTYRFVLDQFPTAGMQWAAIGAAIFLPLPKLQSVTSLQYTATDGILTTLATNRYLVDATSQPARLTPAYAQPWPTVRPQAAAVQVTYVSGYECAADVPAGTKMAVKLLLAHWYRNREAVGNVGGPIEFAVKSLLDVDAVGSLY